MGSPKSVVRFEAFEKDPSLLVFQPTVENVGWKNQIVGITYGGVLYVDERKSRVGYYEYPVKMLEWQRVSQVRIRNMISIKGILFGIVAVIFGVGVFMAGWIYRTHTGPGIIFWPLAGVCGGAVFILGARRNFIEMQGPTQSLRWTSPPLGYKRTLPWCEAVVQYCQTYKIRYDAWKSGIDEKLK